jgi:hypothetical protein
LADTNFERTEIIETDRENRVIRLNIVGEFNYRDCLKLILEMTNAAKRIQKRDCRDKQSD